MAHPKSNPLVKRVKRTWAPAPVCLVWVSLATLGVTGCAGPSLNLIALKAPVTEAGVVFAIDGAGNFQASSHSIRNVAEVSSGAQPSPETVVIERFRRVSDGEINYRFTITDPKLYTQPWTTETSFIRSDQHMYEFACHEGNYGLTNILRGAREADRRAAAAAHASPPKL